MAAAWPTGIPSKLREQGAVFAEGETAIRSGTDSGLARQRKVFTAALDQFGGVLAMTWAQYLTFKAFRQGLGGTTFLWPGHPSGATVEARFVAGVESSVSKDPSARAKWLVPVRIEIMPS